MTVREADARRRSHGRSGRGHGAAKAGVSAYWQDRERLPGRGIALNGEAVRQQGVKAEVVLREGTALDVKGDVRSGEIQDTCNIEVGCVSKSRQEWEAGSVRHDRRDTDQAG